MEELKRNLDTHKLHNICKSCSHSRAVVTVVTVNVTNAKLIAETPDITKLKMREILGVFWLRAISYEKLLEGSRED